MDSNYFYDGMHLKENGVSEIMNYSETKPAGSGQSSLTLIQINLAAMPS